MPKYVYGICMFVLGTVAESLFVLIVGLIVFLQLDAWLESREE
jgi:hypothetical protein